MEGYGLDLSIWAAAAVGFSLMMFGVLTLPLLIGGFVAVALTGLKLGDIRTRANCSVREPVEVTSD